MEWLNVGSLILGSIAWILPIVGLLFFRKKYLQSSFGLAALSFAVCAIAIFFQMMYHQYLIDINDMSALLDTSKVVTNISGILLIFTGILNALNVGIRIRRSN
ncbi:MAG: hypothetical protein CVU94_01330 [Firmicutes bacterium HGW-Firmicutes-19]|jgi:uncharacterized membrane protein YhfC|nr:MAG: hypothetical protein CVU94_01330 [Firmicutes bacterium HGW-Firmicutes-19]